MSLSNDRELIIGKAQSGEISSAEANVQMVEAEGVRVVRGRIPKEVRSALHAAVREGRLGHIKKEGLLPEVFFHRNGRANALEARNRVVRSAAESIGKVCG